MDTTNNLGIVYESIYKPVIFENHSGTLESGSYKKIIGQVRNIIKQEIEGDSIINILRNNEQFLKIKNTIINIINNSEIDGVTKQHLNKLLNKCHNICSLFCTFDITQQLY